MERGTEPRENAEDRNASGEPARAADDHERRAGHLGFVAHEVRNPLSTALWTAELLVRMSAAERGGARGDKLSAMCLRSLTRVRQLVEDHFLCERLDAEGIPLRLEALGARETIEAVLARPPPNVGAATVEADPSIGVEADRALLERALDALVAVAGHDAAPVRIEVRADADADAASFVVTGRPPESASMEDPAKGAASDPTGRALALPVARRIAAALHGSLSMIEGGYVLSLPRAKTYTARPLPAADP